MNIRKLDIHIKENNRIMNSIKSNMKFIEENNLNKKWISEILMKGYMDLEDYNKREGLIASEMLDLFNELKINEINKCYL